jgi:hypothetical protein
MMRSSTVRITKGNAAQSMVETALLLPIIILLMVGILDLGRLYFAYITIFNAAREGARYGISHAIPLDTLGIQDHARQEVDGSIVKSGDVEVTSACDTLCIPGHAIKVTVTYSQFRLITSTIFGGGFITMRATAQMEIF